MALDRAVGGELEAIQSKLAITIAYYIHYESKDRAAFMPVTRRTDTCGNFARTLGSGHSPDMKSPEEPVQLPCAKGIW